MAVQPDITSPVHFLKNCDLPSLLEPASKDPTISATKVVCTLGPACRDVDTLVKLLQAGMNAARIDLTWGPLDYHVQSLKNLAEAMYRTKRLCATIVDTVGREVLVRSDLNFDEDGWPVNPKSISIEAGQEVRISADPEAELSSSCLPVTYPMFAEIAQHGDTFFVGRYLSSGAEDSSVFLEVDRVEGSDVICRAKNASELSGLLTVLHSGVADGDSAALGLNNYIDLPLLAEHDVAAIKYIAERCDTLDFLALTFTRSAEDVEEGRALLASLGLSHVKILAKVEDAVALHNFDGISSTADGIILSRGNLGLDVPPEKMARVQKSVIGACNLLGLPVTLTRIVDTCVTAPRPTRAEATDVANAVLDGVDALMLGAETLRGRFPVQTVSTVVSICRQAELVFDDEAIFDRLVAIAQQAADTRLYIGSPAESMVALAAAGSPPEPDSKVRLRHSLPSVASTAHFRQGVESTRSMASLTAADARRTARLESVASTAVRAASKMKAALIIVYAHSGRTAALVAKYRPHQPVIALMVPRLVQRDLRWQMTGLSAARQTLIVRGVIPLLGAPMQGLSDQMLGQAITAAAARNLVGPHDHVVCVLSVKETLVVESLSVDSLGTGIATGRATGDGAATALPHVEPPFATVSETNGGNGAGTAGKGSGRAGSGRASMEAAAAAAADGSVEPGAQAVGELPGSEALGGVAVVHDTGNVHLGDAAPADPHQAVGA